MRMFSRNIRVWVPWYQVGSCLKTKTLFTRARQFSPFYGKLGFLQSHLVVNIEYTYKRKEKKSKAKQSKANQVRACQCDIRGLYTAVTQSNSSSGADPGAAH